MLFALPSAEAMNGVSPQLSSIVLSVEKCVKVLVDFNPARVTGLDGCDAQMVYNWGAEGGHPENVQPGSSNVMNRAAR
jgi:hypothetical protein